MCPEMMNLPDSQTRTTKEDIISEAQKWIGVRWRHQGRTREHGLDCIGLIVNVAHGVGLSDFDFRGYGRRAIDHALKMKFSEMMISINPKYAGPGDVLMLREKAFPCHVGIIGHGTFIHAAAMRKRCVEEPLTKEFTSKITDAFCYPGVF